jgi:hypothetical protein
MEKQIVRQSGIITNTDFVIIPNQVGYESEIATYKVPQNKVLELPDKLIGLKLATKDSFSFTVGSGETQYDCILTYPIAKDPLLPLVGGTVIVVQRSAGGSATNVEWTNFTVTLPKTVTIKGLTPNTEYVYDIFYLFADGSVNITVVSDDGTVRTKILESSIASVNQLNQLDSRKGLRYGKINMIIPDRWQIQVRVITKASVVLFHPTEDSGAKSRFARQSYIELPVDISSIFKWGKEVREIAKQRATIY